jgi:hypothetical protein
LFLAFEPHFFPPLFQPFTIGVDARLLFLPVQLLNHPPCCPARSCKIRDLLSDAVTRSSEASNRRIGAALAAGGWQKGRRYEDLRDGYLR